MQIKYHISLIILTFILFFNNNAFSQDTTEVYIDTTNLENYTPLLIEEPPMDSAVRSDTVKKRAGNDITAQINYNARDSIVFGMKNKKIYLYKEARVTYQDIELTADYIEFDMQTNEVFAHGLPDSTNEIVGDPHFKQGAQEMEAKRLRYNFKSGRGYIEVVRTEQEGGYLHAEKTKKDEKGNINIKDGKYTTCDAEHPHFYLALTKAKSIPGDKIISGPAYLVLEDVPLPIGLPFGFFPNTKTNTSGILIPSYGEELNRGFYLRNGGYYFAINDYMDLRLTGDIYTNGTWGMRTGSQYRKRYKFSGNVDLRYFQNISSEKGLPDYSKSSDYAINWSHSQDPKANPGQTFRASVNLSTTRFDQRHSQILENALTNTKSSSISFQKRWNNGMNFSTSANHSQNSQTGNVNLNLPKATFSIPRFTPFKPLNKSGTRKWYEDIQLSYTANMDNQIRTADTLLFTSAVWDNMKNGFKHDIPVSWNIKMKKLRSLTFTPGMSYTGVAYTNYINKRRELFNDTEADTSYYVTITDTINNFTYAHAYYPRFSTSLSPKIYGMYTFRPNAKVQQIRHVISPVVSFSYVPDVSAITPQYYRKLKDENGEVIETYSIYEGKIYGTPSLQRSSKTMSFSLKNNVEAKIRPAASDTSTELKKVKLLENLNFSTNLDFDDSIKFQPISFNGNTRFLDGKLNLTFNGSLDPYGTDSLYRRINISQYSQNGKLLRLTRAGMSMNMNFRGGDKKSETTEPTTPEEDRVETPVGLKGPRSDEYDTFDEDYYGTYVDFNIPWSINFSYSLNYSKPRDKASLIQTLRVSGDFSLTPKWKIGYSTGFDFERMEITTSNMSIYRDLHCWEMRLTAVPFGQYKSFNFQINVKSAMLQELKYNKRIPWTDN